MTDLHAVTWNLDGLDPEQVDPRTEAAIARLLADPPDVILLQEVTRRTWSAHLGPHLSHAGFTAAVVLPDDDEGYVEALLAGPGITLTGATRTELVGTEQGRFLLLADATWGGVPIRLATAHLESGVPVAEVRQAQLAQVVHALAVGPPAVFGGDTNLRDVDVRAVPSAAALIDAWVAAGAPPASRYTWDTQRCPNLRFRGPRARFDRFYLTPEWSVGSVELIGDAVAPGVGLWPSDHAGVRLRARLG
ncbi:MAG: endonuclease/exonuclease/phosphatase family metal-dependent hydrolase [Myxococcota bacterium]